jgi:hypothetical protein
VEGLQADLHLNLACTAATYAALDTDATEADVRFTIVPVIPLGGHEDGHVGHLLERHQPSRVGPVGVTR